MANEAYMCKIKISSGDANVKELISLLPTYLTIGVVDVFFQADPFIDKFDTKVYTELDTKFNVTPATRNYTLIGYENIIKLS